LWIRDQVSSSKIEVIDAEGNAIPSQLIPFTATDRTLRDKYVNLHAGVSAGTSPKFFLIFAAAVPPLGYTSFVVRSASSNSKSKSPRTITRSRFYFFFGQIYLRKEEHTSPSLVYQIVSILQRNNFCASFIRSCNEVQHLFADMAKMSSREFYLTKAPRTVHLKSSQLRLTFSKDTGFLTQITNKNTGVCFFPPFLVLIHILVVSLDVIYRCLADILYKQA
jgi:hypothetical protein